MAAIVETIVGDRKLELGNEEFVRQMSIGTRWGKIRIGCRLSINGNTTIPNAVFLMGVCQGTQFTFSSASCLDWIGGSPGGLYPSTSFSWSAGPPARYGLDSGGAKIKKVGSTITSAANAFIAGTMWAAPATTRGIFSMDITKGSPNYNVHFYAPAVASGDISSGTFLAHMETDGSTPPFTTNNLIGNNDTDWNVAYSGSALFDTVSILWNKSSPTIEISDLCVVRFY